MLYLILFLSLTGWGLAGARQTGNAVYGLLWGQSALGVAIYIAALAGILLPGTLALGALGTAYLLYAALYRQGWRHWDVRLVCISSAVFFLFSVWHSRGMRFFSWDEFSHWGLQIKVLLISHALQTQNFELVFPDYIPGMSLYRYLGGLADPDFEQGASLLSWYLAYCGIFAAGSAAAGAYGNNTLQASRWGRAGAIWLVCFIGYYYFFQSLVLTMYVDALLGVLTLASFVAIPLAWNSNRPLLYVAPLLAFMVLTKHVGIVLACMSIGLGMAGALIECGRLRTRDFKLAGTLLGVCLLCFLSWKIYVSLHDLQPHFRMNTGQLLNGDAPAWVLLADSVLKVLQNHFPHAAPLGLHVTTVPVPLQQLWAVMALAVIAVLLMWTLGPANQRRRFGWIGAYLLLCLLAYLIFIATVRAASPWGADMWSFARYLSTLLYAAFLCLVARFLQRHTNGIVAWAFAAILAAAFITTMPGITSLYRVEPWPAPAIREDSERLKQQVADKIPPWAKTWYLYSLDDGFRHHLANYTLAPIQLHSWWKSHHFLSPEALQNPSNEGESLQLFKGVLAQVEYVIVDNPDPLFWERYGSLFPSRDHRVYKVTQSPEGYVELTGM